VRLLIAHNAVDVQSSNGRSETDALWGELRGRRQGEKNGRKMAGEKCEARVVMDVLER